MLKKTILIGVILVLGLGLSGISACAGKAAAADSTKVTAQQTTIQAKIRGDSVSIALGDVEKFTNTRFELNSATDTLSFMSYKYHGQVYVRADICPPCGSQSFTLKNGTLICDTCGTVFNATNGAGIKGACVKFTKQAVNYTTTDGNILMNGTDLSMAFQNTLSPKK